MVTAIAARMLRSVEIDPMILGASGKVVNPFADSATFEREASLEAVDVNPAGSFKVYLCFHFVLLPSLLTVSQK